MSGTQASLRDLNEPELPDDYPIFGDYWYVADGKPVRSDWHRITAKQFKTKIGATVLCRCDIVGRQQNASANVRSASDVKRSESTP